MKCNFCGKPKLANKQSLRAHLRFCPSRPPKTERIGVTAGKTSPSPQRSAEHDFVPPVLSPAGWEFYSLGCEVLVMSEKALGPVAYYVDLVGNLDDPVQIRLLLDDCPDVLSPNNRRRWLRSWCATRGIEIPRYHSWILEE